ncbi:MAG: peptidase S41 [Alphaproteobacteria bacterium CG11_big_fil_rev_8_21_14_0_20_44_7]|nr:MAG: peptidase S41 [Alphaproteobacteria bacterium CG11_big_fil_rev_8_21_14_0_20_44_7]
MTFTKHTSLKFLAFLFVFFIASTCAFAEAEKVETNEEPKYDTYELLNLFGEVFERVKDDYVEEVGDDQLIENAINGMLTSLDPHSGYLNNKAFREMQVQTKGEFGGLGIEVTMENGLVKVVSPIDDTPAFKAGIKAGDYISHIDDSQVLGMTLSDAVEKMRGRVGTKINLTILREGENEPLEKVVTRDIIKIQTVKARSEGDDIGYLRITAFSEQTASGLKKEIADQQKKLGKNIKGYVLDLRNNPGGLLDQAIEVADIFLDQGEIVSTKGRVAESAKRYNATKGDMIDGLPVVVLINSGSASASEIVAGALQDHKRAIVMGEKSFGKGSVQTVIPLTGHGAMRLTTSRYYTPSGRSIQAEGIAPDLEVKQAKLEFVDQSKYLRTEANLNGHLSNDKSAQEAGVPIAGKIEDKTEEGAAAVDDYQLARAIDLIRGLSVFGN